MRKSVNFLPVSPTQSTRLAPASSLVVEIKDTDYEQQNQDALPAADTPSFAASTRFSID